MKKILICLFVVSLNFTSCAAQRYKGVTYAEGLKAGNRYKIKKPIFIMGVYHSGTNRTLSKETAVAYLHPRELAKRYFTAFQCEVPAGTIMTILGLAPKPWYLYFNSDYYFVSLDRDYSRGLDVKIPINRWFEGDLDGLNPEIFSRVLDERSKAINVRENNPNVKCGKGKEKKK